MKISEGGGDVIVNKHNVNNPLFSLAQVFVVDEKYQQPLHAFNQLQYSEEELRLQEQLGRDRLSRS